MGPIAARWIAATLGSALEDSTAFRALLLDDDPALPVRKARSRVLVQIGSIVPDSVRRRSFVDGSPRRGIASGGADRLLAWWRSEDPLPGTARNERVDEHARRVRYAMGSYPEPRRLEGYDDRGDIYVRFGSPLKNRSVRFNDSGFVRELARSGLSLSRSDFPDNEVWVYGGNTEARTYIFIERDGVYKLSTSSELVPSSLRSVVGKTNRDQQRALVALAAARTIYSQLATIETGYGQMWADLQRYAESGRQSQSPGAALRQLSQQMNSAESGLRQRRLESEPASSTSLLDGVRRLDASVFAARFLKQGGQTETEIWWQAVGVQGQSHDLVATLVKAPQTLQRRIADSVRVRWTRGGGTFVGRRALRVECEEACPIALQIDAQVGGEGSALLRTSVWETKPEPLATDRLEMSDIVALDASSDLAIVDGIVEPGAAISLRFEAYGLDDTRGSAQFVVEYGLVLRRLGNLLRRTQETAREGELVSFTSGSRTEQFLLLQTDAWADADEVDVTIRIRDLKTKAEVERDYSFRVRG